MMTEPENLQESDSQKAEEDSLSAPSPSLEYDPSQTAESADSPEEPTLSEGNEDSTLTEGGLRLLPLPNICPMSLPL